MEFPARLPPGNGPRPSYADAYLDILAPVGSKWRPIAELDRFAEEHPDVGLMVLVVPVADEDADFDCFNRVFGVKGVFYVVTIPVQSGDGRNDKATRFLAHLPIWREGQKL